MTTEPLDDIKYWARELDLVRAELMEINLKYTKNFPRDMTVTEQYLMNYMVVRQSVYTNFLIEALAEYETSLKTKRSFWKKFRK